jgi:hypothetical protein
MHPTMPDTELRSHSLAMWANHIETGDVSLSAGDLKNMGRAKDIKPLGADQLELVRRLRALSQAERTR